MNGTLTDARRVSTDAASGRRILFVCTGNTCRSPMAAALLNDMVRPREVCSLSSESGLYASEGAPITPAAAAALRQAGIPPLPGNDYTAHRARTVTAALMEEADEVIAISGAHAMELMMRFPHCASKITTLEADIPDPFGGSESVYRACLEQLSYCIRRRFFGGEGV